MPDEKPKQELPFAVIYKRWIRDFEVFTENRDTEKMNKALSSLFVLVGEALCHHCGKKLATAATESVLASIDNVGVVCGICTDRMAAEDSAAQKGDSDAPG